MPTTLHLKGASDLLAVLPYQLGYHPTDSVVAVALHGSRAGLVQRLDLPDEPDIDEACRIVLHHLRGDAAGAVLLIGYEGTAGRSTAILDRLSQECRSQPLRVVDRIVVRDGRWYSMDCTDPSCCPALGRALPDPHDVPAVAEYVGREVAPLADRAMLAERLRPADPRVVQAVADAAERHQAERLHAVQAWDRGDQDPRVQWWRAQTARWAIVMHDGAGVMPDSSGAAERDVGGSEVVEPSDARASGHSPEEAARLAVSLLDLDLRDGLLTWLCPGWMTLDAFDPRLVEALKRSIRPPAASTVLSARVEARLNALCASLPDALAPGPLCLLAWLAWVRGDGTVARVTLDRALEVDPGYRLAQLLSQMVELAIRPPSTSA